MFFQYLKPISVYSDNRQGTHKAIVIVPTAEVRLELTIAIQMTEKRVVTIFLHSSSEATVTYFNRYCADDEPLTIVGMECRPNSSHLRMIRSETCVIPESCQSQTHCWFIAILLL